MQTAWVIDGHVPKFLKTILAGVGFCLSLAVLNRANAAQPPPTTAPVAEVSRRLNVLFDAPSDDWDQVEQAASDVEDDVLVERGLEAAKVFSLQTDVLKRHAAGHYGIEERAKIRMLEAGLQERFHRRRRAEKWNEAAKLASLTALVALWGGFHGPVPSGENMRRPKKSTGPRIHRISRLRRPPVGA